MTRRTITLIPTIGIIALAGCLSTAPAALSTLDMLYFGLSTPDGEVSDSDWTRFVDEVVTPRFPSGFTVLEARGQWRGTDGTIAGERTRILQIVHGGDDASSAAIEEIRKIYRERFRQEAVLRVTSRATVAF